MAARSAHSQTQSSSAANGISCRSWSSSAAPLRSAHACCGHALPQRPQHSHLAQLSCPVPLAQRSAALPPRRAEKTELRQLLSLHERSSSVLSRPAPLCSRVPRSCLATARSAAARWRALRRRCSPPAAAARSPHRPAAYLPSPPPDLAPGCGAPRHPPGPLLTSPHLPLISPSPRARIRPPFATPVTATHLAWPPPDLPQSRRDALRAPPTASGPSRAPSRRRRAPR